jgi:FAD:protein FMN transferase
MKQTQLIMGMPITVEVRGGADVDDLDVVFAYFTDVDNRYSTYKAESEISRINEGLPRSKWSTEMKRVLALCEETKQQTKGYFDIARCGRLDPSGLVKGWSINNAANLLTRRGFQDFYIEAGGDVQTQGQYAEGQPWRVGIRNPFNIDQIVKTIQLTSAAIATSGTYIRGEHIYNPHDGYKPANTIASLSVIGPNIYDADRFATSAFAMGQGGIHFIESLPSFEGYMIDNRGVATYTSQFERYIA